MDSNKTAPHGWIITVKASGEATRSPFDPDKSLEQLHAAVAGYIELVTLGGSLRRFDAFCNDEGKINALPFNAVISDLYGRDIICGDVVICKHDAMGETIGMTDAEADEVMETLTYAGAIAA